MKVLVAVPLSVYSGYGNDGIGLIMALLRKGIDVRVRPTHVDPPLPKEIAHLLTQELEPPFDLYLNHVDPLQLKQTDHNAEHATMSVGWTMWEMTSLANAEPEDVANIPENTEPFDLVLGYDPVSVQALSTVLPVEKLGMLQGGFTPDIWKPPVERDWTGDRFGFAQPLDAEVLTPRGFVRMGDISVGDAVVDPDGGWQKVTDVIPRGVLDVYAVTFSDGSVVECSGDHLWKVRRLGQPWEVRSADELDAESRWEVPVSRPVQFDAEGDAPVDPYLLGLLLGDGSVSETAGISFVSTDIELISAAEDLCPWGTKAVRRPDEGGVYRVGFQPLRASGPCVRCSRDLKIRARGLCGGCYNTVRATGELYLYKRTRRSSLSRLLGNMGVLGSTAHTKFIPQEYLVSDSHSRLRLLQGLMDTDGTVQSPGASFSSRSQKLAEGVAWLARSLGGTASVLSYGAQGFIVTLRTPFNPFALGRKCQKWESRHRKREYRKVVVSVERVRSEQVQCISVSGESHTYVTNGFTVTHNCMVGQLHDRKDPFTAIEAFRELKQEKGEAFEGAELHLKAQPLDAKVLTPFGWAFMGDLQVGDLVCAPDGSVQTVQGVYPQGEQDIYEVTFKGGATTRCTEDHLWVTRTLHQKAWTVKPLQQMLGEGLKAGKSYRHRVPLTDPVVGLSDPCRHDAMDTYLLGALLGDGALTQGAVVVAAEPEMVERLSKIVADNDCDLVPTGRPYCYGIRSSDGSRGTPILQTLHSLGLMGKKAHEKSVPVPYMFVDPARRLSLLQGLMDTDGTVNESSGMVAFCSTSERLAADVADLVRSLGGIAALHTPYVGKWRDADGVYHEGRLVHSVRITLGVCPFRLTRKAKAWEKVWGRRKHAYEQSLVDVQLVGRAQAQCIKVSGAEQTYITDDYVVTHNTNIPGLHPMMEQWCPKLRIHYTSWPQEVLKKFYAAQHVLLAPSRGEGKNVPAMEMMTTGGAVIATNFGGHTQWLNRDYAYPLNYQLNEVNGIEGCLWASASKEHLKELMWHVYTHRDEVREKAHRAQTAIPEMCSWDAVVDRLMVLLSKRGDKGAQVYSAYQRMTGGRA